LVHAFALDLREPSAEGAPGSGETVQPRTVILGNSLGLHARPAAILAAAGRKSISVVHLLRGGAEVNAKSVVAILDSRSRRGMPCSSRPLRDAGLQIVAIKARVRSGVDATRVGILSAHQELLLEGLGQVTVHAGQTQLNRGVGGCDDGWLLPVRLGTRTHSVPGTLAWDPGGNRIPLNSSFHSMILTLLIYAIEI
jgi:hypothetical protein